MEAEQTQTMVSETELDFILVRQKDRILQMIHDDAPAALRALAVVAELWKAAGYEYKTREILQRVHGVTYVEPQLARLYERA